MPVKDNERYAWRCGKFEKEVLDKIKRGEDVFITMPRWSGISIIRKSLSQKIMEQGLKMKEVDFNSEKITCDGVGLRGEKFVQIPLNKEQRACLLDVILCSKQKHECLIKVIDELDRYVRNEDPERYEKICLKFLVASKCRG